MWRTRAEEETFVMRMAELAEQSGCTVATIKYYQREGLLPPAEVASATQAVYGPEHVERLRLIRVLRDVGELPIARVRDVVGAIDDDRRALSDVLAMAHHGLGPEPEDADDEHEAARREMVRYVHDRRWDVDPAAPSFDVLAGALVALRRVGQECDGDVFAPYADIAFDLAEQELASIEPAGGVSDTVTQIIVGTIVFEQALVALRRLAEEHHSNARFGRPKRRPRARS
jgi:DNA-binding transcriptional MerR regulator